MKKPYLKIIRTLDGTRTDARVKIDTRDARKFSKKAIEHYEKDPKTGEVYQLIETEKRASFLSLTKKSGNPTYDCKKYKIFLNTSKGILQAGINRKSFLEAIIIGDEDFAVDFYRILHKTHEKKEE